MAYDHHLVILFVILFCSSYHRGTRCCVGVESKLFWFNCPLLYATVPLHCLSASHRTHCAGSSHVVISPLSVAASWQVRTAYSKNGACTPNTSPRRVSTCQYYSIVQYYCQSSSYAQGQHNKQLRTTIPGSLVLHPRLLHCTVRFRRLATLDELVPQRYSEGPQLAPGSQHPCYQLIERFSLLSSPSSSC